MIKIARTTDYRVLAKLNEEIQTFHHKIQPSVFKPYNKEEVQHFFKTVLEGTNAVAYLAEENEAAIGYVLLFKISTEDNPFQYARNYVLLDQIIVLKNYQGKGVGMQLLDATFTFAKENSIELVELNHWTQNEAARKFFNRNNFEYFNNKMWRVIQ